MKLTPIFCSKSAHQFICWFLLVFCLPVGAQAQFSTFSWEEKGTLIRNERALIPVQDLAKQRILVLSMGVEEQSMFQQTAALYSKTEEAQLSKTPSQQQLDRVRKQIESSDLVLVGLHEIPNLEAGVDYASALIQLVRELSESQKAVVCLFGMEDRLSQFPGLGIAAGVLQVNSDSPEAQSWAAQVIFGGMGAKGRLKQDLGPMFRSGDGFSIEGGIRLAYVYPRAIGWDGPKLERELEAVIQEGLDAEAYPGCQVLVAKDGKVVLHKAYGYHTYEGKRPVQLTDIYDYASMTKITGALPVLMQLVDEEKIDLDQPLATYWTDWKRGNKKKLSVREILAHQARLRAWIPYYEDTKKKDGSWKKGIYSSDSSETYSVKVGSQLYLNKNYRQKMYKAIRKSKLNKEPGYLYSGLSFYVYPAIIEQLTGESYEAYCKDQIYRPLGAHTITYNARYHAPMDQIVPTEQDTFFRQELLHGYVHDEGASMMGGVSSNAGLFSTANDLAKLMQMYLNYGTYGGKRFVTEKTLKEFTRYQYKDQDNRRGLGFDKPLLKDPEKGYAAPSASELSFGHSGYTGTFAWADPETGILFIFFSNRVHPTRLNRKLYNMSLRPRMHEVVYEQLGVERRE